ncbi:hypothetical protein Leryth_001107 [Lithospermum erythrorhizon]|nr:hypothetical protein Leryth_001107 [Lithospermum erythrorhizon]
MNKNQHQLGVSSVSSVVAQIIGTESDISYVDQAISTVGHKLEGKTGEDGICYTHPEKLPDIQQLKADAFGFVPFRKTFDEGGMGEASIAREAQQGGGTCDERARTTTHHVTAHHHDQLPQHHRHIPHHQISSSPATAYHVNRPTQLISATMAPPPLHHTSAVNVVLDDDAFRVPRILLPEETFQQQHQHQQHLQQQHHKIGGRSASGLEELIMGCTSSTDDNKEELAIQNAQEAEWLKYSSFWPDHDHPDHHHG